MGGIVIDIREALRMARTRKVGALRPMEQPDEPYIPKAKQTPRQKPHRTTVALSIYVPPKVLESFDEWWEAAGIDNRTAALVWLMDDAARTKRRAPLREDPSDGDVPSRRKPRRRLD